MKASPKLRISVIILNWNGKSDTLECLSSVLNINYPTFEIIVADNGSTDDSISAIKKHFPNVLILENKINLGFAEGNNRAIDYAINILGADAVLILNNDTIVDPDILQAFCNTYYSFPKVGILGAVSFYYDNPKIIWAAGGFWDSATIDLKHIGLGLTEDNLPTHNAYEVEYAVGCALFVHKDIISKIGVMDPLFFLNFEENDWCQRARKSGFITYTVPAAKIWHKVSSSFGGESPLWKYYMTRNRLLWSKRYLSKEEHWSVIKKTIKDYFPHPDFINSNRPFSARERYWAFVSWLKLTTENLNNPYHLAQAYGFLHYFLRQFGSCPEKTRIILTQHQ